MEIRLTQDGTEYIVECSVFGQFRRATRHNPAEAPEVTIESVEPEDDDFDEQRAREQITDELWKRQRPDDRLP